MPTHVKVGDEEKSATFFKSKIRRLYGKLRANSYAVGGNDFVAKQKKDATVWAKCSPLYFQMEVRGLCEAECPLKKQSADTLYYTLCPAPLN